MVRGRVQGAGARAVLARRPVLLAGHLDQGARGRRRRRGPRAHPRPPRDLRRRRAGPADRARSGGSASSGRSPSATCARASSALRAGARRGERGRPRRAGRRAALRGRRSRSCGRAARSTRGTAGTARSCSSGSASYDGLVVRSATKVDAELLERASRLRVVGRAGVGVDNVDVPEATKRGVVVCNAPQSNVVSAAEHTIALLLALARNVPQAHAALVQGRWERSSWSGVELEGQDARDPGVRPDRPARGRAAPAASACG